LLFEPCLQFYVCVVWHTPESAQTSILKKQANCHFVERSRVFDD
jgi:hypothetical protein